MIVVEGLRLNVCKSVEHFIDISDPYLGFVEYFGSYIIFSLLRIN